MNSGYWTRLPASVLCALITTSAGCAENEQSFGGDELKSGLTTPRELRGAVYSSTSLELFWERQDPGVRFEIRRDGSTTNITDGVSYFESGLEPSRTYVYGVRAIARDGGRSDWAPLTLSTRSAAGGAVETPQGLRGVVYSDTALELYWERPPSAVSYEIRRDGEVIGQTSGVSYWQSGLSPATRYRYEVTALSRRTPVRACGCPCHHERRSRKHGRRRNHRRFDGRRR